MRILTARPGHVLTDGQTYGTTVCLADDADETAWEEITEELAEQMAEERRLEEDARAEQEAEEEAVG